jgi:rhamnulokinase
VLQHLNAKQIFGETGIQFMPINTLYQLGAESPERLARSSQLLLIADAFNFFLCGVAKAEESLASTTQLYNPQTRAWSRLLAGAVAVERLLPKVVSSGSRLGPLKSAISQETGLPVCEVVASCSHDTAAAVAAVPAEGGTWAFLSSGTWSLLGVEVAAPLLTEACRNLNFTNEIGFGGTIRLLKNIVGLWIVQECRRHWAAAGDDFGYEQLTAMAEGSAPFRSIFQPSDQRFLSPDDMPGKIAAYCQETSQPVPQTHGEIVRATLESLALLYGKTVRELETLIGKNILMLHIVGGGSRNALLNQFTANALDIPVLAGPAEATTTGNILVQAIATGEVQSLGEGRQLVRRSCALQRFEPRDNGAWTAAHERFEQLPYSQYSQPACE